MYVRQLLRRCSNAGCLITETQALSREYRSLNKHGSAFRTSCNIRQRENVHVMSVKRNDPSVYASLCVILYEHNRGFCICDGVPNVSYKVMSTKTIGYNICMRPV